MLELLLFEQLKKANKANKEMIIPVNIDVFDIDNIVNKKLRIEEEIRLLTELLHFYKYPV